MHPTHSILGHSGVRLPVSVLGHALQKWRGVFRKLKQLKLDTLL